MFLTALIVTCSMVLLALYWLINRKPTLIMPGPTPLPLVGNATQLEPLRMHEIMTKWAQTFGPVYRIRILGEDIVIISGMDEANEALVARDEDFVDRSPFFRLDKIEYDGRSIVNRKYDPLLKLMRKLAFKVLHQHQMRSAGFENMIYAAVHEAIENIEGYEGVDTDPSDLMYSIIINTTSNILFGDCFHFGSPESKALRQMSDAFAPAVDVVGGAHLDVFPWLRFIPLPSIRNIMAKVDECIRLRDEFFEIVVAKHKASYQEGHIRGLIDELLAEINKSAEPEKLEATCFMPILFDIINAGILSSSKSLINLLLLLAHHPDVQDKMCEEITRVVAGSRFPCGADMESMPYCKAVIKEGWRCLTVAPFTNYHTATCDSSVGGYAVPKGTRVLVNLWGICHDTKVWKNPEVFDPQNFLTDDGKHLPPNMQVSYMPFSAGKRGCLGETLAKLRTFLIVTSLVQRFKVFPPSDGKLPSYDSSNFKSGVVMMAPEFKVRFVART